VKTYQINSLADDFKMLGGKVPDELIPSIVKENKKIEKEEIKKAEEKAPVEKGS